MYEYLDIVNENGEPTGSIVERSIAHAYGIPHRTSHVWIARHKNGKLQLLVQKRCAAKESFPGCYDISSAGHIPAGVDYLSSALRELKEELGVDAAPEDLILCGNYYVSVDDCFNGIAFHDREYANVYLLFPDTDEPVFVLQPEEVECVVWMDYNELLRVVKEHTISNCLVFEELLMLEQELKKHFEE